MLESLSVATAAAPQADPSARSPLGGGNDATMRPIRLDGRALFGFMLDEIDHAMLLVDGTDILHANRAARQQLEQEGPMHPLDCQGGRVEARRRVDAVALEDAITAAQTRGIRKLLRLGDNAQRIDVAVIPMAVQHGDDHAAVLLVMGKRQVCGDLAVFWFARSHGLTQAESTVLQSLCKGMGPGDIARGNAVAISTVRTQLASIRAKTSTPSLRELVNQVACLPPLVHALVGGRAH